MISVLEDINEVVELDEKLLESDLDID